MPLRLVYLPDPTIKFYTAVHKDGSKEYFTKDELFDYEIERKEYIEILIRPGKAHHNILKALAKRFSDNGYSQPYFQDLIARTELFEIMEVPNGKTRKAGARKSAVSDIS
jgi:hypothetical protein